MKKTSRPSGTNETDTAAVVPPAAAVIDDGLYWEGKVADALGLARERVRSIRQDHLKEGVDFRLVRNEVVLTEPGSTRLNEIVAAQGRTTPADPAPPTAKFPVPKGPPLRARFTVLRIPANRRLLWCAPAVKADRPAQVLVHVKDNTNFMPRMELEAIEAEQGSWQFRGRLPRRKGKW